VLIGGRDSGEILVDDHRVPVVSATGSTAMGRQVGPKLASRFARAILELGGNNAAIVAPSADLDLALRGIAFAAMGTVYGSVKIGDPRENGVLVGPLIDKAAFDGMQRALDEARAAGAAITGGTRQSVGGADAYYVAPALVEMKAHEGPVKRETFAPIALFEIRRRCRNAERCWRRAFLFALHARHA